MLINFFGKIKKTYQNMFALMCFTLALSVPSFAFATTPTGLTLNFDMSKMFEWAQMIIDIMMPVLYIVLGVALGFIVIRALKSAFA